METRELIRNFRQSFVATAENIEKLVDDTKDWTASEMSSVSIALGMTAGCLYALKMEQKYGKKVSF